jgi:pyrimidine operon attenuation protein/uracil phosphoribosyltransferase
MEQHTGLILDEQAIARKLRRMAYEIYERNAEEKELILAGILDRGRTVASHLERILREIADFKLHVVNLLLDRGTPREVTVSGEADFNGKVVIVIDDVANTGRTMLYAMKPVLASLPEKIQTAVLVDRTHKSFPVVANYIGHSLSTTLQENIRVDIRGDRIRGVYLS